MWIACPGWAHESQLCGDRLAKEHTTRCQPPIHNGCLTSRNSTRIQYRTVLSGNPCGVDDVLERQWQSVSWSNRTTPDKLSIQSLSLLANVSRFQPGKGLELGITGSDFCQQFFTDALHVTSATLQGSTQAVCVWLRSQESRRHRIFLSRITDAQSIESSTPAATAEPITPETLGPIACINR